ncbi:MAG: hypothetical protein AAGG51_24015 [Cyanobacteria bacterium P01_G01_bin.54]
MEPLTLAATAIAATIMTKFWEKTGEQLSEELFEKSEAFYNALKQKAPKAALAIEQVPQAPLDYGKMVLEVDAIAQQDAAIAHEIQHLAKLAEQEPNQQLKDVIAEILKVTQGQQPTVQNMSKIADKIGLLVQSGTVNIENFSV